ncbi:sugar ABC transporter ATP-binding protein [Limimaricola pyoseonensis]|uniref:Monosaccharide ABC transporter ATP-binding protein, CUT2 family n=1 Tax=Limimaricola pyoseonensis TaxID=521013 RepID=A0A1G7FM13_9RHOB|nr:sugar ABC transporter ATP-binding protein [Limimaricola pyoseonensis]SDE76967.1 monosaccharide ABC transporter ATP-binding protein, CUT2 family [Limimaricola pyoseonensis]
MGETVCEIRDLRKSFGQNHVLLGIDLELRSGEVTVLMGANGAGKSTLVKVLCGHHRMDGGHMTLAGAPYAPHDAAEAIARGVVTVHQSIDDGVIPDLDVATNLMLDRLTEPGAGLFVRDAKLRARAAEVARGMGLTVDVRRRVADLDIADRQMIAIARAMARAPKVLVLDEPTSSLSAAEAERLFSLIDRLRAQGVAILYISHRMSDIRRLADKIVCMRDGAISGVFAQAPLDYEAAVAAMLGHKMTEVDITPRRGNAPVLECAGLQLQPGRPPIDLTLRECEVVAVTGLLGSGKTRLAEIIYGLRRPAGGTMRLDGAPYAPRDARAAVAAGVFLSPKDRGANAVIPDFDIADNMTLPFLGAFSRLSLLSRARQRDTVGEMVDRIGVVCRSPRDGILTLSGGNQQKVMIGRWLIEPCRVLLLDEPFQGVDIGARRDIGRHIRDTAAGRATIVLVAEIDEAIEIADRIIVLNEGALAGEHVNENIDLGRLVAQVSGPAPMLATETTA